MITLENLRQVLTNLDFTNYPETDTYFQEYECGGSITVDFRNKKINYEPLDSSFKEGEFPSKEKESDGFIIHRDTTINFNQKENFVCLVCVHYLLKKGYEPKHIVFEPAFKVGHKNKPAYGDILVFDKEYKPLVLIENKTAGSEFSKEWNLMHKDGGQLFSYIGPLVNDLGFCENLVLYSADYEDEKINYKSNIVTLKDNEKHLAELNNPRTFKNAQGQYYEVWTETYAQTFETKGLFEDDIEPYTIGKLKYTIKDLNQLTHSEISTIYHEFATILRHYAITDFEHTFYILIDLFLCKITDEINNPNDLQFYYKGITRDTPKAYCSRLLKLYQQGKKQLFNVDVVNKEESDIKQLFEDTSRSLTNGLFDGIKKMFEDIKFYNIKKFNFISVENQEEFELNFQILIKIAALIQDINLSNSETNHFFGDLFEGLLSKNVHQTEGQFFTPLPITNFIINSLPEFPNNNSIKVLDYACGAGHFLTEFVKHYPKAKLYGIEKSQTLSQVAKIATILNGSSDARIVFKDALSSINTQDIRYVGFDNEGFDCIIANPPYSVKGFIDTLDSKDRNQFTLMKEVDEKAYSTNKSIECFFIERAVHFLKRDGVLGIVLPSSMFSNGKIYSKTREIIFSNFNILGIAEMNRRTFGSTGTNTVILFAQRVKKNAGDVALNFMKNNKYESYTNHGLIFEYIKKQGYDKDAYIQFMQQGILENTLDEHEIFKEYKESFSPETISKTQEKDWFIQWNEYNPDFKENSQDYKKLFLKFKKSDEYKFKVEEEHRKQFISYVQNIELKKLKVFIEIADNNVIVLNSPPEKIDGKSNKSQLIEFLGYDWSNRKGDEGIKYVTENTVLAEETEDEEDEPEIETINSINYVKTPLYSPSDCNDSTKFSFAIRKHFNENCKKFSFGESKELDGDFDSEWGEYISTIKLTDLVDFDRATFDMAIRTSGNKRIEEIKFKKCFQTVKLDSIAEVKKGTAITSKELIEGDYKVVAGGINYAFKHNTYNRDENTITISASGANAGYVNFWNEKIFASDCITIRCKNELDTKFIYNVLKANQNKIFEYQRGAGQPHVYKDDIKTIKLPIVQTELKEYLVKECSKFELEIRNLKDQRQSLKEKINNYFDKLYTSSSSLLRLSDLNKVTYLDIGKRVVFSEMNDEYEIPVYSANVFESVGKINMLLPTLTDFNEKSVIWGIDGDWMVNTIQENIQFYPTDHCGVLRVDPKVAEAKYICYALWRVGMDERFSRTLRASEDRISALSLPLPSLDEQKKVVKSVELLEKEIKVIDDKILIASSKRSDLIKNKLIESDM